MRESDLERETRKLLESVGGRLLKIRAAGMRGFPDRVALLHGGKIAFIEFKQPGKTPRPEQFRWLSDLRALGFEAFWTNTVRDVEKWIADNR